MIRLDSPTRKLLAVLSDAVAANEIDIVVGFRDEARPGGSGFPSATVLKKSAGAVAVDICDAPGTAVRRWIDLVSIHNTDTAAVTVTVQYNDDGVIYKVLTATLQPSENLLYTSEDGWRVTTANGYAASAGPTGLSYKSLSASGLVKTGAGNCHLLLVSSSSSLTVKLWDNTSAAGTVIVDTMSVDAREEYDIPAHFATGLYVTLGGTGSVTVFYA